MLSPNGEERSPLVRARTADDLSLIARRRRRELGRTQDAVTESIGTSRKWLADFESGKPTAEVGLVMRLLEALDLLVDVRERPAPTVDLDDVIGGV